MGRAREWIAVRFGMGHQAKDNMILCGIDVETTGTDEKEDFVTEIAWAIFDTADWTKPLVLAHHYVNGPMLVSEAITELTGITNALLTRCGKTEGTVVDELARDLFIWNVDHLVAHNAPFDRKFIEALFDRNGLAFEGSSWIDTQRDILYPKKIRSRNLITLCVEHGFMNPFPHSALFDVFSMMKMLSHYAIEPVLEYRDEPNVVLQALCDFGNKEKAKARGFRWNELDGVSYPKMWVKAVKRRDVAAEIEAADFQIKELSNEKESPKDLDIP